MALRKMEFTDLITDVDVQGEMVTCRLSSSDLRLANLFRRSLLQEIPTYCIDIVSFDVNTSSRQEEILAFRLGQLVIDHTATPLPLNTDLRIEVRGPGTFTSDDIKGIVCKHSTPIAELREDQEIKCSVRIVEGVGFTHSKWCPVSGISLREEVSEGGEIVSFLIRFRNIGMLDSMTILEEAFLRLKSSLRRPPQNIFLRVQSPLTDLRNFPDVENKEETVRSEIIDPDNLVDLVDVDNPVNIDYSGEE